jgi:acid phosphatase
MHAARAIAGLAVGGSLLLSACSPSAPVPGGSATPLPATPSATRALTPAPGTPTTAETSAETPMPSVAGGPSRIWLIVLENRSYEQVIGSPEAPYLNRLAGAYGLASDYHGVARPSEPNYLALVSGSTQGVTDDGAHSFDAPTLFQQLDGAGRSWRVYAENVPTGCFTGSTASGGPDGPGTYARKHEPAISFRYVSDDAARCARISGLSSFDPAAADVSLIVPNLCHDMHDCSTAVGDAWLKGFLPRILDSPAWQDNGLVIITFDEAAGGDSSQRVPLIFAGPGIAPGTVDQGRADHYALLRTIQAAFGLPCLAQSCAAVPMEALLPPP